MPDMQLPLPPSCLEALTNSKLQPNDAIMTVMQEVQKLAINSVSTDLTQNDTFKKAFSSTAYTQFHEPLMNALAGAMVAAKMTPELSVVESLANTMVARTWDHFATQAKARGKEGVTPDSTPSLPAHRETRVIGGTTVTVNVLAGRAPTKS